MPTTSSVLRSCPSFDSRGAVAYLYAPPGVYMRSIVFQAALAVALLAPGLDPPAAFAAPGEPGARAPAKPTFHTLSRRNTIPVSEIKPGMEGYGLTVFEGT